MNSHGLGIAHALPTMPCIPHYTVGECTIPNPWEFIISPHNVLHSLTVYTLGNTEHCWVNMSDFAICIDHSAHKIAFKVTLTMELYYPCFKGTLPWGPLTSLYTIFLMMCFDFTAQKSKHVIRSHQKERPRGIFTKLPWRWGLCSYLIPGWPVPEKTRLLAVGPCRVHSYVASRSLVANKG